jgi:OOP family OmpA-OmpF porin
MRYTRLIALVLAILLPMSTAIAQQMSSQRSVVAEGVVADQATKELILGKLRGLYGAVNVIDRVQVEAITTPPNWGEYVAGMITPGLQRVSSGQLEIKGQSVRISGQVGNEQQRQQVASDLSLASNTAYTVTNSLKLGASDQSVLDQTLANRIIEFRSGSAQLTPLGASILDEMVTKMAKMQARFLVVGHTDDVGDHQSNLKLSRARALAVKNYLVAKDISAQRIDVLGKGSDEPVVGNDTDEGRARNRRIEFKIQ